LSAISDFLGTRRPIPLWMILLIALGIHGPLLLSRMPLNSYDANFHIFMASHYAQHWFNPWNTKSFAGFSQTTYPPLPQQWIAVFSHIIGLVNGYVVVQLIAVLLLPIGVYRYAKLWVSERAASYAALLSVFTGSLSLMLYEAGQLGTTASIPLYLIAIPYFYDWARAGNWRSLLKGVALGFAAAAAHHATLLFGTILFVAPVLWLVFLDRDKSRNENTAHVLARVTAFALLIIVGVAVILLPYWIALWHNPIEQVPIPHQSRNNFLLTPKWGVHYWVVPYGALILVLPFIFLRGSKERRLRPLMFGFWVTMLFGLGGTTPFPRWVLGRAFYVLTFERFTFWATLMALPFAGLLIVELVDRYRAKAAVPIWTLAVATCALSASWNTYYQLIAPPLDISGTVNFLNSNGRDKYRYLVLGFGNQMARVQTWAKAESVDGDYNSGRSLPELTHFGGAQLSNSKHFGTAGMSSLQAMLKHADHYGLKYVIVRDTYYEPMLVFGGFRKIQTMNDGLITVWVKPNVPEATPVPNSSMPPRWQGILWGVLPFGSSILALILMLLLPDKRDTGATIEFPGRSAEREIPAARMADTEPAQARAQRQMRIALVSAFPPSHGDLNEYGYHLARELQRNPHVSVTVLADHYTGTGRELDGFAVQRCWLFNSIWNPLRILHKVEQLKPDVVWFNMGFSTFANRPVAAFLGVVIPGLARMLGYQSHVTLHTFMDNVNLDDAGVRVKRLYQAGGWLGTKALLMASGVSVLLPSYRRVLLEKYKADGERVHVHSHGILGELPDTPFSLHRGNPPRVLAFGNWGTYKRLELLIAAMSEVVKQVPDAKLVIAGGDHPKTPGYVRSVAESCGGLDYIEFAGYVAEDEIPALFHRASVLVMPYTSSAGSSGVAHLACQYGVPIVAAEIRDLREMAEFERLAIDFYQSRDAHDLIEKLAAILQCTERQEEMAQQNYLAAQRITMAQVVQQYLNHFDGWQAADVPAKLAQSWQ
jgi:glycosyltransferase involved in cell wall biosynthesis